jgi:hypothetical protein
MSKVKRFQKKNPEKPMTPAEMRRAIGASGKRTVVREFAPGITFEVQRVDLGTYLAAGLLPEHFYRVVIEAQRERADKPKAKQMVEDAIREMDAEELTTLSAVKSRFVVAACVSPKVVLGQPKNESEISLLEIPEETQSDIFAWAMSGCPGIPIEVGGEEIEVEDLDRFRPKRTGGKPFTLEPDGEQKREAG